ncbi:hypothetical protein [Mycolicibacterium goodii]|uniref:Uncharacterized protein n=1 Tax=Mycolicibacterium goodii TaxID=134601 RepID=A0ABS6HP40_MYCGD|nr:hypothetical protein [Mycolicibacterium goodii]MBU8824391.1 hypothetical protein [Mycolicibacterium goodii]MBU8837533.1 hypothetical protein [Mycolicibacterium goodii]
MSDLDWFYGLSSAERVALLRDPNQDLPGTLADRLVDDYRIAKSWWESSGEPPRLMLAPHAATKLIDIRARLDHWWSNLSPDERAYIAENREGHLESRYHDVVQAPAYDPVTRVPLPDLVVVSDHKTGLFRLPRLMSIYVEMQEWPADGAQ